MSWWSWGAREEGRHALHAAEAALGLGQRRQGKEVAEHGQRQLRTAEVAEPGS
jgi:hypothetical protein